MRHPDKMPHAAVIFHPVPHGARGCRSPVSTSSAYSRRPRTPRSGVSCLYVGGSCACGLSASRRNRVRRVRGGCAARRQDHGGEREMGSMERLRQTLERIARNMRPWWSTWRSRSDNSACAPSAAASMCWSGTTRTAPTTTHATRWPCSTRFSTNPHDTLTNGSPETR